MPCFDISGFQYLSQGVLLKYQQEWGTFERIYNFNSNVSTLRSKGNTGLTYYNFFTTEEQAYYINGQQLHVKRYPTSNWDSPVKS